MSNHITPKHYEAIGELIVIWSHFEAQMALGIIALSGMTKQAGAIATVDMNAKSLINTLRYLARLKIPQHAKEFDKIFDGNDRNRGLRKIYPVRNLFAHSTFGPGKRAGFIKPLSVRLRDELEIQEGEFDAAGISEYARLIQERAVNLRKLLEANGYGFDQVPTDAE